MRDKYDLLIELLSGCKNVDNYIDHLITGLVETAPVADAGIFFSYDENSQTLSSETVYGLAKHSGKLNLVSGEGLPGICLEKGKPLLINSSEKIDKESTATLRKANLNHYRKLHRNSAEIRSVITVPFKTAGKLSCVIQLERFDKQKTVFTKADIAKLESFGRWAALMLEYLRVNSELKNSKLSYRELFGKFLASNEAERKAIAREIHDEINHILLSVKLNLEDMENSFPPEMDKTREKVKKLYTYVGKAFDDLHRLSFELRPPGLDDLGLPQALEWYISILSGETGLNIKLETGGLAYRKPAPVVETALLRITQEALSNTVKHAGARSAHVRLNYTKKDITLEIEDDGKGFETKSMLDMRATTANLGLLGMKERAEMCGGVLTVSSSPEQGTRIKTVIPIGSFDWGTY